MGSSVQNNVLFFAESASSYWDGEKRKIRQFPAAVRDFVNAYGGRAVSAGVICSWAG